MVYEDDDEAPAGSDGRAQPEAPDDDPGALLRTARGLIRHNLHRLQQDVKAKDRILELDEARMVAEFARVLIQDEREARRADDEDLGDLSEEELLERVKKLMAGGGGGAETLLGKKGKRR